MKATHTYFANLRKHWKFQKAGKMEDKENFMQMESFLKSIWFNLKNLMHVLLLFDQFSNVEVKISHLSLNLYIDSIQNIKFTCIPCSHLMQYGSLNFSKSHIYHPWLWITNCSQAHLLSGVVDLWGAGLDELGVASAVYPIILTHHCWLRPVQLS